MQAGLEGRDHTVTALVFSVIQALIGGTQNGLDGVAIATGLLYADAHCDHGWPLQAMKRTIGHGASQTLGDFVRAFK